MPTMRRSERSRERQRALRQPDMFFEGGEVHPIRGSPGYDTLEDRAGGLARRRRDQEEEHRSSYEAGARLGDALRGYRELRGAMLAEGGISPNRDYRSEDIPRDVLRHNGKPADEMAQVLQSHGFHYDGDVEMMRDLRRRRSHLERLGVLQRA